MVHEREPTRLLRLRTLDALEPLAHRPLSLLKLLDALVHESSISRPIRRTVPSTVWSST